MTINTPDIGAFMAAGNSRMVVAMLLAVGVIAMGDKLGGSSRTVLMFAVGVFLLLAMAG